MLTKSVQETFNPRKFTVGRDRCIVGIYCGKKYLQITIFLNRRFKCMECVLFAKCVRFVDRVLWYLKGTTQLCRTSNVEYNAT